MGSWRLALAKLISEQKQKRRAAEPLKLKAKFDHGRSRFEALRLQLLELGGGEWVRARR